MTVAEDAGLGHIQPLECREGALGAEFLNESDDRVEDHDDQDGDHVRRIAHQAGDDRGDDQHDDHEVGELTGEHHDGAASAALRKHVASVPCDPAGGLVRRQASVGIDAQNPRRFRRRQPVPLAGLSIRRGRVHAGSPIIGADRQADPRCRQRNRRSPPGRRGAAIVASKVGARPLSSDRCSERRRRIPLADPGAPSAATSCGPSAFTISIVPPGNLSVVGDGPHAQRRSGAAAGGVPTSSRPRRTMPIGYGEMPSRVRRNRQSASSRWV